MKSVLLSSLVFTLKEMNYLTIWNHQAYLKRFDQAHCGGSSDIALKAKEYSYSQRGLSCLKLGEAADGNYGFAIVVGMLQNHRSHSSQR